MPRVATWVDELVSIMRNRMGPPSCPWKRMITGLQFFYPKGTRELESTRTSPHKTRVTSVTNLNVRGKKNKTVEEQNRFQIGGTNKQVITRLSLTSHSLAAHMVLEPGRLEKTTRQVGAVEVGNPMPAAIGQSMLLRSRPQWRWSRGGEDVSARNMLRYSGNKVADQQIEIRLVQ